MLLGLKKKYKKKNLIQVTYNTPESCSFPLTGLPQLMLQAETETGHIQNDIENILRYTEEMRR